MDGLTYLATRIASGRGTTAATRTSTTLTGPRTTITARLRLDLGDAVFRRQLLEPCPPGRDLGIELTRLGTQQHEVVGCAETRMLEKAQRAPAGAAVEPRLQGNHVTHRQ